MTGRTPTGGGSGLREWLPELGVAAVFVVLLAVVSIHGGPVGPDSAVVDALPPRSGADSVGVLSTAARFVSELGEPSAWTLSSLIVAVGVALSGRTWLPLRLVALPVAVSAATVLVLKAAVGRTGPPGEALPRTLGYFPSGHTATTFVCTGALAALLAVRRPQWARVLRIGVGAWTVLMGAALVYYRYHWVTDAVASLLLGWVILRIFCRALWAPGRSADDPAPEDDALRLREDA